MAEQTVEQPQKSNEIPLAIAPTAVDVPLSLPTQPLPLTLHPDQHAGDGFTLDMEHKIAAAAQQCINDFNKIIVARDTTRAAIDAAPGFKTIPKSGEYGKFKSLEEMSLYLIESLLRLEASMNFIEITKSTSSYFETDCMLNRRLQDAVIRAIKSVQNLPTTQEIEKSIKDRFIVLMDRLPQQQERAQWLTQQLDSLLQQKLTLVSSTISKELVEDLESITKNILSNDISINKTNEVKSYFLNSAIDKIKYLSPKPDGSLFPYDINYINREWGDLAIRHASFINAASGYVVKVNPSIIATNLSVIFKDNRRKAASVANRFINKHYMLEDVAAVFKEFLKKRIKNSDIERVYGGLFKYIYNEKGDEYKDGIYNAIIDDIDTRPYGDFSTGETLCGNKIEREYTDRVMATFESGINTLEEFEAAIASQKEEAFQTILKDMPEFIENWLTLHGENHEKVMALFNDPNFKKDNNSAEQLRKLTSTLPLQILDRLGPNLQFDRPKIQSNVNRIALEISETREIDDKSFVQNCSNIKNSMLILKKSQMFANIVDARRSIKMKVARDIGSTFESVDKRVLGYLPQEKYPDMPAEIASAEEAAATSVINSMKDNKEFLPLKELGEELEKLQLASMRSFSKTLDTSPDTADMTSLILRLLSTPEPNMSEIILKDGHRISGIHKAHSKYFLAAQFMHDDKFLITQNTSPEERRQKGVELAKLLFEFLSKDTSDSDYNDQYDQQDALVAYRSAFNNAYKNGTSPSAMVDIAEAFAAIVHDNSLADLHMQYKRTMLNDIVTHPNFKDLAKSNVIYQLLDLYAKFVYENSNIVNDITLDDKLNKLVLNKVATQDQVDNSKILMDIIKNKRSIDFTRDSLLKLQNIVRDSEYIIEAVSNESFTEFMQYHEPKDAMVQAAVNWEQPKFRFGALPDKSPEYFTIGIKTDCCQHLGGAGAQAAVDSFINKLAAVLIMEVKDGDRWQLAYQSYFHYIPEQHAYILDNIEGVEKYFPRMEDLTGHKPDELYHLWAQHMKSKYPELTYIALGLDYTKIPTSRFAPHVQEEDPRQFHDHIDGDEYSDYDPEGSANLLDFKSQLPIIDKDEDEEESDIELGNSKDEYVEKIATHLSELKNMFWRSNSTTNRYNNFNQYEKALKKVMLQFLAMHNIKKPLSASMEEIERAMQKIANPVKAAALEYRAKLFGFKIRRRII